MKGTVQKVETLTEIMHRGRLLPIGGVILKISGDDYVVVVGLN